MSIGAAVRDAEAMALQFGCQVAGILDHLALQLHELWRAGQLKGYGHAGDGIHVRATLLARKDGSIDLGGQFLFGRQDACPPGAVEGLVGREADGMGVADWAGHDTGGNHAGDVRDVGQQVGTHRIGDLAEPGPIGHPGVGGVPGDDHADGVSVGLGLVGEFFDGLVIQALRLLIDAVGDDVVQLARPVGTAAVGEMASVQQIHTHDCAAGWDQGCIDGAVGRGAGERLDVGPDLLRRY